VRRLAIAVYTILLAVLPLMPRCAMAEGDPPKPVSFIRDVAPILVGKCQACHGPKTAESNYRLDMFEKLMRPGDIGSPPVTATNLDESGIYQLITADDPEVRMPNNGERLADSEIETIANWIRQGAKFDGQNEAAPLRDQIPRDIPHPAAPMAYPFSIPITAMAFTSDGSQLLVGGYHELLIWDPVAAKLIARVGNISQRTFGLAFNADESLLAVAGGSPGVGGEVRLIPWAGRPKQDAGPRILALHNDVFFDVAFRPDGKQLVAAGADGSVREFDMPSGVERLKIGAHSDWVVDVCYSPDGKLIATASRDKTAKIFDAETGRLIATHSENNVPVRAVAFAPDGKLAISADGSRIRVWNVQDAKLVGEMTGFQNDIYALLADGENIVAGSADQSVRQFKLADRSLIRALAPHSAWVISLAWHPSSARLTAGCFDGTATTWNLKSGAMEKQFLAIPVVAQPKN
jgi:DNA-binding beta-propeller fold protein YncE